MSTATLRARGARGDNPLQTQPVRNGFDPADVRQEAAIAQFVAERQHPGDGGHAALRVKQRVARWRIKERNWGIRRISIMEQDGIPRAQSGRKNPAGFGHADCSDSPSDAGYRGVNFNRYGQFRDPQPDRTFEKIFVREILDLLPYALHEETLTALLSNDYKRILRVGRMIRAAVPQIASMDL